MSPRVGLDMDTILQAAGKLADEHGWEEVTLAKLAKTLGIRSPSLYNHFAGLPELRERMAVYALRQLYDRMLRAAAGRSEDEAIFAIGEAYLAFARSHPGLYEAAIRAPSPEQVELVTISSEVVGLLTDVLASYGLKDEDAIHTVRGLRSILHGFASLEQKHAFGLPLDLDETYHRMLRLYIAGIHRTRTRGD